MKYFWSNTIWYLLLSVLTMGELAFILYKTKKRKFSFAYYLTLSGSVILLFETFVFLIFRGYDYYPKIIYHSPFDDNLLGKVFSQLSVSATALLVSVFNLNIPWILLFAGIYGLVEEWFIQLGIYRHNWYQTWMTVVALIGYFWLAKKYYQSMTLGIKETSGIRTFAHYLNVFSGLFPVTMLTIFWAFSLSGYQGYTGSFCSVPDVCRILVANIYLAILEVILMVVYFLRLRWHWKLCVFILLTGFNYLLAYKMHFLWYKNYWWFLLFSVSTLVWTYASVVILDKFYKSNTTKAG